MITFKASKLFQHCWITTWNMNHFLSLFCLLQHFGFVFMYKIHIYEIKCIWLTWSIYFAPWCQCTVHESVIYISINTKKLEELFPTLFRSSDTTWMQGYFPSNLGWPQSLPMSFQSPSELPLTWVKYSK